MYRDWPLALGILFFVCLVIGVPIGLLIKGSIAHEEANAACTQICKPYMHMIKNNTCLCAQADSTWREINVD